LSPRALPDQNTAPASLGSEALLEAVTACISGILHADSLLEALPHALQSIARVVRIDRLIIVEGTSNIDHAELTPQIFFIWNSEGAPHVDAGAIIENSHAREAMDEWLSPLRQGHAVSMVRRLVTGPMHELMTQLQVVSTLQVPMMLDGVPCGVLVFDDCRGEREDGRADQYPQAAGRLHRHRADSRAGARGAAISRRNPRGRERERGASDVGIGSA
jgi:hypothetical protein